MLVRLCNKIGKYSRAPCPARIKIVTYIYFYVNKYRRDFTEISRRNDSLIIDTATPFKSRYSSEYFRSKVS